MNNKGKITVFLCLIISSMMILGLTIVKIVDRYSAREKTAMCGRIAMSNVKAGYNSYIFENYHILLFDMNCEGKGEASVEEQIEKDMEANLGDSFQVENVAITNYTGIMDNNCEAFKNQIADYMVYAAIESVGENILATTGGEDGTLSVELEAQLDDAIETELSGSVSGIEEREDAQEVTEPSGFTPESEDTTYDPRDFTSWLGDLGILCFVVPEDMEVSKETIDMSRTPSFNSDQFFQSAFQVNYNFDNIEDFESDVNSHSTWADTLLDTGYGIAYAKTVFNSATNRVNDSAVFDFEMEYLICGKESDYKNLEGVVSKISAIRLPVNYAYLMSDSGKISQIKTVSVPLSLLICLPEPVVRHLIAGCWAYVESLCEVKNLLEGKELPFKKDSTTWMTDLFDFESSIYENCKEVENGLSYEDYLIILLAMEGEDIYLRMLDLMQLNATYNSGEIFLRDCGVELSVDISVTYDEEEIFLNMTTAY